MTAANDLLLLFARPRTSLGIAGLEGVWGAILKASLPVVAILLLAPLLWWFFRATWQRLDAEAADYRQQLRLSGKFDARPLAVFAIVALVLTIQEYYGGSRFYSAFIRPWLLSLERAQATAPGGIGQYIDTRFYGELYSYSWWALTRVLGYTLVPMLAYKMLFRKDSLLDMGLRTRGFLKHGWIYLACLAVVVPCVFVVAGSPEFANYYPFYKRCSRSWFDLLCWEGMYIAQFFALELFFRGFMLSPLRKNMGTGAIFAMCVPYVMIHFGKPYLEATGAFVAGVALGSLAMRTRSIYSGFLVHATVALLMDGLALAAGPGFPVQFWPR